MAIYNGGILGEYKNKVGNVVGRKWRNLDVMSKYQPDVSNPRTEKQQNQRKMFGELSSIAKALRVPLRIGMSGVAAGTKNPYRTQFISRNKACATISGGSVVLDYLNMKVAEGGYPYALSAGSPSFDEPLTVAVNFSYTAIAGLTKTTDKVYLVVYNTADNMSLMQSEAASAGSISVKVPNSWNGETVHVWAFVVDGDVDGVPTMASQVTPSHYVGNGSIS